MTVAGTLALSAGCVDREAQKQAKRTEELLGDPTVPVTVAAVRTETLLETLEVSGEITTSQDTSIGAQVGGRLVAVHVREGDFVAAGQVIAQQESTMQNAQARQGHAQVQAAQSALSQALANAQVGPQRSAAGVATAEAQLRAARAQLAKARAGARSEEVAQATSQVAAAKSSMETAKKDVDRYRILLSQGAISQQRFEQAENAYRAALASYESALEHLRMMQNWTRPEDLSTAEELVRQAEETLRTAKAQQRLDILLVQQVEAARANVRSAQAQLDMARQAVSDTQIRSPFAGRVFGKPMQPGTFLAPGSPVARLVGAEGAYFEGAVPEGQVPVLAAGKSVRISLDAFPGRTFTGRVVNVSPQSTEVARIFNVRISIDTLPEGAKPGMFARGEVELKRIPDATVVPDVAVVEEAGQSYVFALNGDTVSKVRVSLGRRKDGLVQVTGIEPGASVVVDGATKVSEGTKVKVQSTAEAARASLESGGSRG